MRIIAGTHRGRRLRAPRSGVRPTADRVREALFGRLGGLEGQGVLDLYGGSGALGLEAISRGAARVTFVEASAKARVILQHNIDALGVAEQCRLLRGDAIAALRRLGRAGERYDLVFVDPPYDSAEIGRSLGGLLASGILRETALVVVETTKRHAVTPPAGLVLADERLYGDTRIVRLQLAAEPALEGGLERR